MENTGTDREVRKIETDAEKDAFRAILRYSFQSDWPDHLFPLPRGCEAWGAFDGARLTAGLVDNRYRVRVFGKIVEMSGIGGVASLPEGRNSGHVRRVMVESLRSAAASGCAVAALYPFSFAFYEKFGYGNLGPELEITFPPEKLRFEHPEPGHTITDLASREGDAAGIAAWYNDSFADYDLSSVADQVTISEMVAKADSKGNYAKVCVDGTGNTSGIITYAIQKTGEYTQELTVDRLAWRTPGGFRTLMWLLWTHRNQCAQIRIRRPDDRELTFGMREPRIERRVGYYWMARALDVPALIGARAEISGFDGKTTFSLRDPCIEGNTGTYTVTGGTVSGSPFDPVLEIPFPVFSSLLFGRLSIPEAVRVFDLPPEISSAHGLFGPRKVHITEGF